ncbi:MAG TPA: hypothetical protein VFE62_06260 [Gemmataceae bacterium]|nr:hypothetical protein [Gemmataceae bacterium]
MIGKTLGGWPGIANRASPSGIGAPSSATLPVILAVFGGGLLFGVHANVQANRTVMDAIQTSLRMEGISSAVTKDSITFRFEAQPGNNAGLRNLGDFY